MGQAQGAGSLSLGSQPEDPGDAPGSDNPAGPSDLAGLLHLVGTGDQHALAQVYDLVAPRVFGLALRVVRDRALAEEVTQEVFLQVWRQAGEVDPGRGSPLGWLMTLTHRRAVDRVRSEQAQSDRLRRYEDQQTTPAYDSTEEEVVRRVEAQRLHQALALLGEPHRTTVELAYFGGLTHREVASRLDIPLGTAKTRIRDGLRKLKSQLVGGEQG